MFSFALGYAIIGIIIICSVAIVHLYSAESQGYAAFDYWEEALPIIEKKVTADELLWSLIIWPIRLWQFIAIVKVFYDIYDWRKYGPRRRKGWL